MPFSTSAAGQARPRLRDGIGRRTLRASAALLAVLVTAPAGEAAGRPNVVVILADDLGYADLGVHGRVTDVRTPHLDRLAAEGVLCTAGYVTAPQCSPSRAGLLTGRYQQRFGLDRIEDLPMPLGEVTLAERLSAAGYVCGMVGKWHLDPVGPPRSPNPPGGAGPANGPPAERDRGDSLAYFPHRQGFGEFFVGSMNRYYASHDLAGRDLRAGGRWVDDRRFRVDVQTDAAVAFLKRNRERPFFLYVAYFAPHVPLEATRDRFARFPGPMPERRRHALAMTAAVDDGIGRILAALDETGRSGETLVVFLSDNGAPLLDKQDLPISTAGATWDGSLNDPWVGEKGMLTEGGVRVPFVLRWPGTLPAGRTYDRPVSALDIAATVVPAAGLPHDPALDGVDLVPYLTGARDGDPHDALYWRFWNQAAVRAGRWKFLTLGDGREYLFDLEGDAHETRNVAAAEPETAARLKGRLETWAGQLRPAGLPSAPPNASEVRWYATHFGSPAAP